MSFFKRLKAGDIGGALAEAKTAATTGAAALEERTRGVRAIAADKIGDVASAAREALASNDGFTDVDIAQAADAFAAAGYGVPDGDGGWREPTRDECEAAAVILLAAAAEPDDDYDDGDASDGGGD